MIFKDFYECKKIVLEWEKYFEPEHWVNIMNTIYKAETLHYSDKNRIFMVVSEITEALWHIDEAITMGYRPWMIAKKKETENMLEYYKNNNGDIDD